MKKKVEAIIQARMGSSRLSRKVMLDLGSKPVLGQVIERVQQSKCIDDIIVATSSSSADDDIEKYLNRIGVKCFRGDESDVLSRCYLAANKYPADAIVRITADCPLIDPQVIDKVVMCYLNNSYEYVSNVYPKRTFPRGLDCEIFSFDLLKRAFNEAVEDYEKEHVTPFMYLKQESIFCVLNDTDYSDIRITLDTVQDFLLIQKIYSHFYSGVHNFYMQDICEYIKNNPELYKINSDVEQKQFKPKIG